MTDPLRVELVAAALRRDLDDLDLYARFLQNTLQEALPAGLVEVDRRQSVTDRLRGRSGTVTRLSVALGERRYVLYPQRGVPRAEVVHVVKGLALDHDEVSLDVWIGRLAEALTGYAADSARTAELLARVTDPGGAFG